VRLAVLGQLVNVAKSLARRVADGLGVKGLPAAPRPASPVQDLPPSPALRIIDRMKATLQGRCVGILVSDGSNMKAVAALRKAATDAGATVKLVAPRIGIQDAAGKAIVVDGQLAGTPSTVFDAVASVIPLEEGERLSREAAAVDWFRDAFGHLKAIAACNGTRKILAAGGIEPDAGVVLPEDVAQFVKLAATRQWGREPKLRTLA
jgi:catalase